VTELPTTRHTHSRGEVCVVIAAGEEQQALRQCLESVRACSPRAAAIVQVAASAEAVNRAIEELWPADVVVLEQPCRVEPGWLERLREAAREDSNTATVSALTDLGGELALLEREAEEDEEEDQRELERRLAALPEHTLGLRPRLSRAVGPCVYVRREAVELVGALDEQLELCAALELDFSQRCVLSGLGNLAADDVVVRRLAGEREQRGRALAPPAALLERYPQLADGSPVGDSGVLARALEAARGPQRRPWVTFDASALDGAVTGTQVHVLELIRALANTGELRLRVLVRGERIDTHTLGLLRELPHTEILEFERLTAQTPRSTVFHRPQQTFSAGDVALALSLGERFVVSQLDLIAYRNPGYFSDPEAWRDYRRASRHGLSAAERVIVFSQHTRRELLADALAEDERIRVVAPGLDHRATAPPRPPAALAQRGEPGEEGYLLCLGTDFRHKNRVFALRLAAALREHHDWSGRLLLAGTHIPVGSSLEQERALLAARPQLAEAVLSLGAVDEAEKTWLLEHAGAVVYPSAYEGFGLVPFEAALAGVPCVFAAQSSLAEVAPAGTAPIVPWDERASAAAAHALLTDAGARAEQVRALAGAARELTWQAAAQAMVGIYREAAIAPVRDAATLSRDLAERERRLSVEHEREAAQLTREREHAARMYDELNREVGFALGLIGPRGALPEALQRALLALSARPAISRPLFGALAHAFLAMRALARALRRASGGAP